MAERLVRQEHPKPRKVTVGQEPPKRMEYDREVAVELWHNTYQTTVLRLSKAEAQDLYTQLGQHLQAVPRV